SNQPIGFDSIADRMLHKSICDKNEISGNPTTQRNGDGGQEMRPRTESLLAPDERTNERALQKEREHAFHCECLSDYSTGIAGKVRPIRAKLKLHGNAGDDSHSEVESENLGPKSNGLIVLLTPSTEGTPFPIDEEPRQAHGELRKEIVIDKREAE